MNESRYDGLVPAGGRSRRFGRDKRIEPFAGETLAGRAARKLAAAGAATVYVATGFHAEHLAGVSSAIAIPDSPPGCGPLGGICAALQRTRTGVLVLAPDLPLVRVETLRNLARLGRRNGCPVALRGARGWEPLVAYYPRAVLNDVRAAIHQGSYAPHRLLTRWAALSPGCVTAAETTNVNTPAELDAVSRSRYTFGVD